MNERRTNERYLFLFCFRRFVRSFSAELKLSSSKNEERELKEEEEELKEEEEEGREEGRPASEMGVSE